MQAQFAKMREAMDAARKAAMTKIEEVLTKDQMISFEKSLGKPFDLKTLPQGRGPGGPPGGGPRPPRTQPAAPDA
jgi:hypothetical protein